MGTGHHVKLYLNNSLECLVALLVEASLLQVPANAHVLTQEHLPVLLQPVQHLGPRVCARVNKQYLVSLSKVSYYSISLQLWPQTQLCFAKIRRFSAKKKPTLRLQIKLNGLDWIASYRQFGIEIASQECTKTYSTRPSVGQYSFKLIHSINSMKTKISEKCFVY